MISTTGIIPARYGSSRFPGKPLALIDGIPMIRHVYEKCLASKLNRVAVATDDLRIKECVLSFGGDVVMTSPNHLSGTDRCGEAARILNLPDQEIIINIQGDEPLIDPQNIDLLIDLFQNQTIDIATLASPIDSDEAGNPNIVKVTFTNNMKAIYFSRSKIPFIREEKDAGYIRYFKHIGVYAFRHQVLQLLIKLPESLLERAEKLEQLRWVENEYNLYIALCNHDSMGIDTPEDLIRLKEFTNNKSEIPPFYKHK